MALQVDILTPRRQAFSGTAGEVRVPGWEGEFGVLPGHDLFLSLVRGGICTVVAEAGGEQRFVVGRGFAEVGPERVTLLTDSAEPTSAVDKAAAQRDLEAAESAMGQLDVNSAEFKLQEEKAELARAKLSA